MPGNHRSSGDAARRPEPSCAEALCLLLLDRETGRLPPARRQAVHHALAGSVLVDLALAKRIENGLALRSIDPTPLGGRPPRSAAGADRCRGQRARHRLLGRADGRARGRDPPGGPGPTGGPRRPRRRERRVLGPGRPPLLGARRRRSRSAAPPRARALGRREPRPAGRRAHPPDRCLRPLRAARAAARAEARTAAHHRASRGAARRPRGGLRRRAVGGGPRATSGAGHTGGRQRLQPRRRRPRLPDARVPAAGTRLPGARVQAPDHRPRRSRSQHVPGEGGAEPPAERRGLERLRGGAGRGARGDEHGRRRARPHAQRDEPGVLKGGGRAAHPRAGRDSAPRDRGLADRPADNRPLRAPAHCHRRAGHSRLPAPRPEPTWTTSSSSCATSCSRPSPGSAPPAC